MQPTQLGPYEITSRLGRGGMGAVYAAVDTITGGTVAVKVLASHLADDPGVRSRFDAEIEALKNLRHPGIVRLLAFGEQDDQPFFAMELVRGKSLEQILRGGRRFTWRETVAVAIEVTRALKAAHDQGIVHRDLKPANLLVTDAASVPEGLPPTDGVRVKLADFGIAKLFGGASHTALGHVVGTAEYMAPEQAAGKPMDHRVDLYALGLVMFAMLTGSPPFRGVQLTEVIDKQRRAVPPRVASLVRDVPPELDELIARLLSKDPSQRPASALALGRLLSAIQTVHSVEDTTQPASVSAKPSESGKNAERTAASPAQACREEIDLLAPTQALPSPPSAASAPRTTPTKPAASRSPQPGPTKRGVQPAGSTDVTRDLPVSGAVSPTAASLSPATHSRLPTDVASATTQVDRSQRNQFTTVAEVERAAAARERREQLWQLGWQGLTFIVVASALTAGGWMLLKPPSADQMYDRIMAVADDEHGDLRDVRAEMESFLEKHAGDPRSDRVRALKRKLDLDQLERRARRRSRGDKAVSTLERDYRAAINDEDNGPSACMKSLEAMLAVHGSGAPAADDGDDTLWIELARRKLDQLRPLALAEQRDDAKKIEALMADAASLASRADIANDEAARSAFAAKRRKILQDIVDVYDDRPHAAEAVAFAKRELAGGDTPEPKPSPKPSPKPTASPQPQLPAEPDPFVDPSIEGRN